MSEPQPTDRREIESALLLRWNDFREDISSYGDKFWDSSSNMLRHVGQVADIDPDFRVSLGDLVLACDLSLALQALENVGNRKAILRVIWPTIAEFSGGSKNSTIMRVRADFGTWLTGDGKTDLNEAKTLLATARSEIGRGLTPRVQRDDESFFDFDFPVDNQLVVDVLEWCIDFAGGKEERYPGDPYYGTARFVIDRIIESREQYGYADRSLIEVGLTAQIVYLSPPFAILGHAQPG